MGIHDGWRALDGIRVSTATSAIAWRVFVVIACARDLPASDPWSGPGRSTALVESGSPAWSDAASTSALIALLAAVVTLTWTAARDQDTARTAVTATAGTLVGAALILWATGGVGVAEPLGTVVVLAGVAVRQLMAWRLATRELGAQPKRPEM